jgi:hypothetical protein
MEVPSSLLSTYQSTWPNWIAFQSY